MIKMKNKVEQILQNSNEARNNDSVLLIQYYKAFGEYGDSDLTWEELKNLFEKNKPDEIIRYRRRFNQLGKYKATNLNVLKKRRQKIETIKGELGYISKKQKPIYEYKYNPNTGTMIQLLIKN